MTTSKEKDVFVIYWSECDDGWVRNGGRTYHMGEEKRKIFVDKILSKNSDKYSLMPEIQTKMSLEDVPKGFRAKLVKDGSYEDFS